VENSIILTSIKHNDNKQLGAVYKHTINMEENAISNDDDRKRKRGSSIDRNDSNVYLTGLQTSSRFDNSNWFTGLRWTKSPEEAAKHSDWSLDVKRQDMTNYGDDAFITYSVHRNILEFHSDYFKSILGKDFKESNNKRNTIELPTSVVTLQHLESLLDYCYTGNLTLDPLNAVAMVYLGDYLQIKGLLEAAQYFIWNSIKNASSEELLAYYQDAKGLLMEHLQKAIEYSCAQRPVVMRMNTAISKMPDTDFWCRVWEERKHYPNQTVSSTREWSDNLAHFTDQHHDIVDVESFRKLTHFDSLPVISPDAAVSLMEQEQELKLDCSTKANPDTLTCLQKRCTEALYNRKAGSWRVSKKDDLLERLKNLPYVVLDTIISWTMEDKRIPTGIEVSGAGLEDANGVYAATGIYNKKLMFTKPTGGGEEYFISSHGCKSFFLSASTRTDYLYHAEHKNEESSLPPKIGWGLSEKGKASPPPTLRFTYD
jgi:hypothetical protein